MATAQDLTEAMNDAMEARNVERAARAGYDGGSWGYHGNSLIEARYKAEQRVSEVLNELIVERVRAELAARVA